MPVRYPSSQLPSFQGSRWVTSLSTGTASVLAKSINQSHYDTLVVWFQDEGTWSLMPRQPASPGNSKASGRIVGTPAKVRRTNKYQRSKTRNVAQLCTYCCAAVWHCGQADRCNTKQSRAEQSRAIMCCCVSAAQHRVQHVVSCHCVGEYV